MSSFLRSFTGRGGILASMIVPLRVAETNAWVMSTSQAEGTYRGNVMGSRGVELVVLTRELGGWKIAAIHWSSHRAR